MMKLTKIAAIVAIASASFTSTHAVAELSANVAATSNYLWRGMEQTGGDAAISGGIDYSHESGFYAGTWASNATWGMGEDSNGNPVDGEMETELDLYFGYSVGDLDVGFVYFAYPDANDAAIGNNPDFSEIYLSYSLGDLSLGFAVLADADGADFGDSIYLSADYAVEVGNGAELAFHAGMYDGDFVGEDSQIDLGVSISKDSFTFGASKMASDDNGIDDDLKVYVSYALDFEL
ncbi:hypothetical protein C2869_08680 [Saccharobesus litoralis]|uniref:Histidine kinase n=1 Tax=Saccharobesus litoralis TaxID=2172099 RepID=A0A2S0VQL1_9ALTE|nr:TorF family putative porin [Saccharobesus litoralis]AWB66498.1 hypothetical protein C2869_08680 [Saccharobesus litoralis]